MRIAELAIRVAGKAAEAVSTSHGLPGAGIVVEALLRDLLQVQDEQARILARLEADVQRLLEGPWRTAHLYMQESLLPGRSATQIEASLRGVAAQLREALALQPRHSFSAAYAAFDLAIVLAALGDKQASKLYAQLSVDAASGYLRNPPRLPPSSGERILSALEGWPFLGIIPDVAGAIDNITISLKTRFPGPPGPNPYLEWYYVALAADQLGAEIDYFQWSMVKRSVENDPIARSLPKPDWW